MFGFTATGSASVLSAGGFLGLFTGGDKGARFGAKIGGSLISGDLGFGINIAGFNIGILGGAKVGAEAGFEVGADKAKVDLGPFDIGLRFGRALESE